MNFGIETQISNFIRNQFPRFYDVEGENFILFVQAYYEWLESNNELTDSSGNVLKNTDDASLLPPIYQARNLLNYRDIDNTLPKFLDHFQQKYLYGIPFNIIVNKKLLLKHILDVYRSKGSVTSFKLLFKLIYNQDAEIYLPNQDILKPSDGTWTQPTYIEVTDTSFNPDMVGKTIIGVSSNVTAVVESVVQEPINENIITTFYISNITPLGASFIKGEKVVPVDQFSNSDYVGTAPSIIGSFTTLDVQFSTNGFKVGDILGIASRDINTNQLISSGKEGKVIVSKIASGNGNLVYSIAVPGFGYNTNSNIFIYNNEFDNVGSGASFSIRNISSVQSVTYNTDLIVDYANLSLNSASFGFTGNTSANLTNANLDNILGFKTELFGAITSLGNIDSGSGYQLAPYVFVRNTQQSTKNLTGSITYSTSSNTITGVGTSFATNFANNDVVYLIANSSNTNTSEQQIVKNVVNNTVMVLYGPPTRNSTATAGFRIAPITLPSNFAYYEPVMKSSNINDVHGKDETISAYPNNGNNLVGEVISFDSGRGYIDNDLVSMYVYNSVETPTIALGGSGYSNGELILFTDGSDTTYTPATGYVMTNSNGVITSTVMTNTGSGYKFIPSLTVKSANGTGAVLTTTILEYDPNRYIFGAVNKSATGKKPGYWSTTRSFLNSDKYVQDSYFYQDFSYQVKVAATLDKYKTILYNTFHPSGSELFGKFYQIDNQISLSSIAYEQKAARYAPDVFITADNSMITVDSDKYTADQTIAYDLSGDDTIIKADSSYYTADQTFK